MSSFFRKLLYSLRRSRHDADLRAEIEAHRTLRQDALERRGLPPARAAQESRRAMGNVALAVEDARDVWAIRVIDSARQDLRDALRGLRRNAGVSAVVIGTLALGIGANTSLFSIFNALVIRQLPVRDPGSLAMLADGSWSYPVWEEINARDTELFDGAFAWADQCFNLSIDGQVAAVDGAYVSGRFFDVLGVPAFRGRTLTPEDDSAAQPDGPVAVISHTFWLQHFAGMDDVIGRQFTVLPQQLSFTIVGVMPPGFAGVDVGRAAHVVLPFSSEPLLEGQENTRLPQTGRSWLNIIVRLKRGQNIEEANALLRSVQPQLRTAVLPGLRGDPAFAARYLTRPLTLESAATGASGLRRQFETPLLVMVVAVGLVLLVACANIATLLLARALARREELSVRLALGGTRWRLARLLFVESALVTMAGAALGLLFSKWSSALLLRQFGGPISLDLSLDWRVLAFTSALTGLCAITSGLTPMIGVKGVAPGEALKSAGRGLAGDRRFAVRGALVVAQIAVSFVLVTGAGLFLRTFVSLSQLPLGFAPESLVAVNIDLAASGVPPKERGGRIDRLRDAAGSTPGVRSAAASLVKPLTGGGWFTNNRVAIGDGPLLPENRAQRVWLNAVSPGWFRTMGIPVRGGRDFSDSDRVGSPPVAIINEAFARRYLRGQPPIGISVRVDSDDGLVYNVIGVVADAVYTTPRDGMVPTIYVSLAQLGTQEWTSWSRAIVTVKSAPGQRALIERDVAAALKQADPSLLFTSEAFDRLVSDTMTEERLVAMMSGFFGGLALLLAGLGLYGVVAQAVTARRTEIGLRMALGAQRASILRLTSRRVGALVAVGLFLGVAGSWWTSRFVAPLLFAVAAGDLTTLAATAAVLVAVAAVAAWVPARRATLVDPVTVLREG